MMQETQYDLVKVGEVVSKTETRDPRADANRSFLYVDIASVCNRTFSITSPKQIPGEKAPSRARKVIRAGDVIFATTRPYLKNVAMVPRHLDNQICSTGFCVLRATSRILPEWLFLCVTSEQLLAQIKPLMRGANYPAVTDGDVLSCKIPLPPLPQQRRIVARIKECLERVEEIERLRAEALAEADKMVDAALHEEWAHLKKSGYGEMQLGELGKITTGNTPSRKVPAYFGGRIPWVTPGDFDGRIIREAREHLSERAITEANARLVPERSVLVVCIGATIGKVALAGSQIGVNQQINAIDFDRGTVLPEFGYWACRALKKDIVQNARKNTLPILNKSKFAELTIPVPPLATQESVSSKLNRTQDLVTALVAQARESADLEQHLRDAILRKAFAGEL